MLKHEFKGQIVSKLDLGLLNAYKLMYFDRNINRNKDEKNLGAIIKSSVTLGELHFSIQVPS